MSSLRCTYSGGGDYHYFKGGEVLNVHSLYVHGLCMDLLQMDCLREPFFDHDDRHRHLAVRILMTTSKWLDNDDYVIM